MFDLVAIQAALSEVPLGGLRVFQSVTSTNDEALAWASAGAPDLSLVVADEQTAGRGRAGRRWSTPVGTALALSLIIRGGPAWEASPTRLTGLGALAVADACGSLGQTASIKWPNDVLLQGRKVAGVLVEALWSGEALEAAVVGIGVNVLAASTPSVASVRYPATSMEACLAQPPDRLEVLRLIVAAMFHWRGCLASEAFIQAWRQRLAFQGQTVVLTGEAGESIRGELDGLEADGSLRLLTAQGTRCFAMGELHLAAADDTIQ